MCHGLHIRLSPDFDSISSPFDIGEALLGRKPRSRYTVAVLTRSSTPALTARVATLPMTAVLRTRTIDESAGFMKVLVEKAGDRILGFTMIGPEAGEVMAAVQTAMLGGLPYTVLRDAILTHPTMAEGLSSLFAAFPAPG
jgi:hypothetical protein